MDRTVLRHSRHRLLCRTEGDLGAGNRLMVRFRIRQEHPGILTCFQIHTCHFPAGVRLHIAVGYFHFDVSVQSVYAVISRRIFKFRRKIRAADGHLKIEFGRLPFRSLLFLQRFSVAFYAVGNKPASWLRFHHINV